VKLKIQQTPYRKPRGGRSRPEPRGPPLSSNGEKNERELNPGQGIDFRRKVGGPPGQRGVFLAVRKKSKITGKKKGGVPEMGGTVFFFHVGKKGGGGDPHFQLQGESKTHFLNDASRPPLGTGSFERTGKTANLK